ncbi:MAG: hypothetical protein JHD15_00275 [Phenylobacterium sp.]|uniref:hypothetical protein n=1 Tax=Phenylobacterium sp. TaxID=1871053 RepID=UPI001A30C46B|nr:hypothetical protein [Phenylobacterium sp.]MBJ7408792.1 hypothetical protein [Phenylobacterium sp.]
MSRTSRPDSGRSYAAWAGVLGALFTSAMLVCYLMATRGDLTAMYDPAWALAMPAAAQTWFVAAMVVDSFGVYLPFLLIGGYLWGTLRPRFGAPIDMATLALGCYVLLGLAGASMQIAALPALAAAHAAGDAMVRAASESSWLTVVMTTQGGLWPMEGPLMAFWGIVVGRALMATGDRLGGLLATVGVLYGAYFVAVLVRAAEVALMIELLMVGALTVWMLLTGVNLLRKGDRPVGEAVTIN